MNTQVSKEVATDEVRQQASTHQVLIVDDSSVARNQMQRSLEDMGIKVTQMTNGKLAWNHLEEMANRGVDVTKNYLMMISDIEMPEMDGYTLTAMIREDPRMENMHIVLHTSLSGGFNVSMVKKVGANGFLAKFNPDDLATAVVKRLAAVGVSVN